jgi:hypothetical protein
MKFQLVSLLALIPASIAQFEDYEYVFNINVKTDDTEFGFCYNNGFAISNGEYSYDFAELACAEIGKELAVPNEENFNYIGFALAACKGEESEAWISQYNEWTNDDECVSFIAESFLCGSMSTTFDCEKKMPVICK